MVQPETGRSIGELQRAGENRSPGYAERPRTVENLSGIYPILEKGFISMPEITVVMAFLQLLRQFLSSERLDQPEAGFSRMIFPPRFHQSRNAPTKARVAQECFAPKPGDRKDSGDRKLPTYRASPRRRRWTAFTIKSSPLRHDRTDGGTVVHLAPRRRFECGLGDAFPNGCLSRRPLPG